MTTHAKWHLFRCYDFVSSAMRRFPSTAFLSTVLAANICSIIYVISSIEDDDHGKSVGDSASIEVKNILEVETDLEDKEEKEALEDEDKENMMKDFQIGGKVDLGFSNELPSGIVLRNSEIHSNNLPNEYCIHFSLKILSKAYFFGNLCSKPRK